MALRDDPETIRKYNRDRAAKCRAEWLAGKSCVKCGSAERLEVDHIDRTQKVGHNVWSWTPARRAVELAKCQVLCRPCHQEKTWLEIRGERKHGTSGMYRNGKCRCEECRAYKSREDGVSRRRVADLPTGSNGLGRPWSGASDAFRAAYAKANEPAA